MGEFRCIHGGTRAGDVTMDDISKKLDDMSKNGKCSSHEDIVVRVTKAATTVTVIMALLATMLAVGTALDMFLFNTVQKHMEVSSQTESKILHELDKIRKIVE